MKKLIFIFVTMITSIIISSCDDAVKDTQLPTAKIKFHNIKEISLIKRSITLQMSLDIYNPYPVEGTIQEVNADLFIQDKKLSEINIADPKIKASDTVQNPFDAVIKLDDLYKIYKDIGKRKNVHILIKGAIKVEVPEYGSHSFNFQHTQELPAIKIKLKLSNFNIQRTKISKLDYTNKGFINVGMPIIKKLEEKKLEGKVSQTANFDLTVTNLTQADISFNNLKIDLLNKSGQALISSSSRQAISSAKTDLGYHKEVYRVSSELESSLRSMRINRIKGSVDINLPSPFGTRPILFSQKP